MAEAGTVEEDDLTVHELCDGKPLCGEAGMVHEWLRAVNCGKCLTARSEKAPRRRERPWRNPAVEDLPPRDSCQDFVIDLAKNDPTTVSVRSLADAGDSAHPYGVVITTGHGESRWQFVGQLPEGERHREDGGDPAAVEGTPLPAGESPQANDDPETWLAALLSKAESPQVAAVERWSTREGNRPDHVGLTITFYNTARIFARRM